MKRVDDTFATHDSLIFTKTLTFVDYSAQNVVRIIE